MNKEDNESFSYIPFQPYNIPKTKEEHEKNLEDLNRNGLNLEFIDIKNIKGTKCIKIKNKIKAYKHLILVLTKNDIFPQDFINSKINLLKKENNIVLVVSS